MTDVLTLTTNGFNSPELSTYYDDVFLERAEQNMTYDVLFTKKTLPKNSGKVIFFTRQTPRAVATTALTEGVTPSAISTSSVNVSATIAEYGDFEKISSLFSNTTIDKGLKERVEVMGQAAGETIDTLLRDILDDTTTVQLANSKAHASAIASTDTMSVVELRKAVKTLKRNKAPKFEDGFYRGVLNVGAVYDLQGDNNQGNFVTANQYKTPEDIKKGEIGRLGGVIVFESNNEEVDATYSNVYSSFIAGKGCAAMVDLNGAGAGVNMKTPGANDTSNPLDMYSTLAWKIPAFAGTILNHNWVVNVKTYSV